MKRLGSLTLYLQYHNFIDSNSINKWVKTLPKGSELSFQNSICLYTILLTQRQLFGQLLTRDMDLLVHEVFVKDFLSCVKTVEVLEQNL